MLYNDAFETALSFINADLPVMLWGAPGVAKSALAADLARETGRTLIDERLSTLESLDLRGTPHVVGDNVAWAMPTMFAKLWRANARGEATILFLDEIVNAAQSTQAAAYQLVLNRCVGDQTLPPDCAVMAAGNRQSDKAAAQRMPTALANRFAHIDLDADADTLRAHAARMGWHPIVIAFLAFRPASVHDMSGQDARAFPSPRAWESVSKVLQTNPADHVRPRVVRALIGEAWAGEFEAFARTYGRIPSIDSILADPRGAMVPGGGFPGEAALCFAVATGLAARATVGTMDAVWTYAQRMSGDFAGLIMTDATRRDPALTSTRAYINFATATHGVRS